MFPSHDPESIGDNASVDASFAFSMSDTSGLKFSTAPLILDQPQDSSGPLQVVATGKHPLSYQWYIGESATGPNAANYTASADGDYYCVISNDLGQASTNVVTVDVP